MENDITRNVTIPLDEFLKIRDDACDFDTLVETILSTSRASYCEGRLLFSDDAINEVMRFIAPLKYLARLKELEKAEEED